jgi:P27 family predicted phage terminase small subunit
LYRLGLLTVLDVMPFAAYCAAHGRRQATEEIIQRVAVGDPMSGLLVKGPEGARRNPLVKIAADCATNVVRYGTEFGMTPASRSRVAAEIGGPPDNHGRFSGLISPSH